MNYRRIDHQQELQRFQREIDQLRDQNAAMEIQVKWLTIQLHEDLFMYNVSSSFIDYVDFWNYLCVTYMYMPELLDLNGIYLKPVFAIYLWPVKPYTLMYWHGWDLAILLKAEFGSQCRYLLKYLLSVSLKLSDWH